MIKRPNGGTILKAVAAAAVLAALGIYEHRVAVHADPVADARLDAMDAAYRRLDSLSCDVVLDEQTTGPANSASFQPSSRHMAESLVLDRPNFADIVRTSPLGTTHCVCDGANLCTFTTEGAANRGRYLKVPIGGDSRGSALIASLGGLPVYSANTTLGWLPGLFFGENTLSPSDLVQWRSEPPATLDGRSVDVVTLTDGVLSGDAFSHVTMTLFIDPSTHLLLRAVKDSRTKTGVRTVATETYASIKPNAPLGEEAFRFSPPTGSAPTTSVDDLYQTDAAVVKAISVGQSIPDIPAKDTSGKPLLWSQYAGKVVLLSFWSTWCAPCRQELPQMTALQSKYRGNDFQIVGVALETSQDPTKLNEFTAAHAMPWREIIDTGFANHGFIPDKAGIPYMILVGRDGLVKAVDTDASRMSRAVDEIMKR